MEILGIIIVGIVIGLLGKLLPTTVTTSRFG
jgi:uncharacterized membrane protein YeaQ/YmgE (transglycosylase-associated protein family)